MVPMFDPMIPEVTLLFAVSPALAGVLAAIVGAAAVAITGALWELRDRRSLEIRADIRHPVPACPSPSSASTAFP